MTLVRTYNRALVEFPDDERIVLVSLWEVAGRTILLSYLDERRVEVTTDDWERLGDRARGFTPCATAGMALLRDDSVLPWLGRGHHSEGLREDRYEGLAISDMRPGDRLTLHVGDLDNEQNLTARIEVQLEPDFMVRSLA